MQTIIQILMLSDNIFFDFRGSSIRLQDCGDWVLEEKILTFKKDCYKIIMMRSS